MGLYLCLTNVYGDYEFEVQLVFSNTEMKMASRQFQPMNMLSPTEIAEVPISVPETVFNEPGEYEFRLLVNGEFVERQNFYVRQAE
jgi:hypothetical protein